jgi:SAM-dependent methyltransferase
MIQPSGENAEQIRYWNEEAGPKWIAFRDLFDAQLRPLGERTMDRAGMVAGDRVIDVGCGCGQTSVALARRVGPAGRVLGIDVSTAMIEEARREAAAVGLANVRFENVDARTHSFERGAFDVVYSRFGVMFFADPAAAFANLRKALRSVGRLAFVCWQPLQQNQWAQLPLTVALRHLPAPPALPPDAPGPFSFADPERVQEILSAAGFKEIAIEDLRMPLTIGGSLKLADAVEFLVNIGPTSKLLQEAHDTVRSRVREEVLTALQPFATGRGVRLGSAAWVVTGRAGASK